MRIHNESIGEKILATVAFISQLVIGYILLIMFV